MSKCNNLATYISKKYILDQAQNVEYIVQCAVNKTLQDRYGAQLNIPETPEFIDMCYEAAEQLTAQNFKQTADTINQYFDTHNIF